MSSPRTPAATCGWACTTAAWRAAGRAASRLFSEVDGVPAGLMQGLYDDQAGRLWIATGAGGAARVDDADAERPRFVTYTLRDGLASNNLRCFAEDGAGHVYVGTARGLDRLDVASGRVEHETAIADLPGSEVTAAFHDALGTLWIGTRGGLVRRRPAPPPEVWLRRLSIAGVERPLFELGVRRVEGLELSHHERQIEVEYFAVDFAADRRLGFQYRFAGAEWSPLSEQRTLTASLAPGRYRLEVRALRDDGVASPEPATLALRVLPPLWQRGWFLAALALAGGALGYLFYRQRVRRLLALERVRTRIATDLHDDIGASLSRIAILSEVVRQSAAGGDPEARRHLLLIAKEAIHNVPRHSRAPRRHLRDRLRSRPRHAARGARDPRATHDHALTPASRRGRKSP